jgi:Tfp pilus assembly protein PilN
VSVGHERSTFAVSDGRVCEFTRVLEWGGWALNVAIARALDLSPSEVEPLKRALAFGGIEAVPAGFTQEQLATGREAARKQLQTFARELVSSLQFYQNQPGSLGIGEVALTGGTAHMAGLAAELERLIGVPVRVADPLGRLVVSKKVVERGQVGSLAIAIGLGIEDASYVPPVDLLPRDDVRKSFEANRGVAFGAAGGTALATAVLASMLMSAGGAVDGKRTELDSLRAQIAAIPVVTAEDTSDEDMLAAEKGARVGALSAALADRVAWDRVLRQVSLVLPEDVWLTNLSAAAPGGAAPVAGTATAASGFTLTGATYSQNGVARFLSRLSVVPDLRNVRLQSSQSAVVGERELVQFTILADVRAPGDAVVEAGS